MKIHGIKREWSNPIFCIKKHACPYCNERLEKIKIETIVNSNSEEAKIMIFLPQVVMVFSSVILSLLERLFIVISATKHTS